VSASRYETSRVVAGVKWPHIIIIIILIITHIRRNSSTKTDYTLTQCVNGLKGHSHRKLPRDITSRDITSLQHSV